MYNVESLCAKYIPPRHTRHCLTSPSCIDANTFGYQNRFARRLEM